MRSSAPLSILPACFLVCVILAASSFSLSAAGLTNPSPDNSAATDLTILPLEELMNVEVTSVSKKAEKLYDTSAAIFVVTREDIRRSGATSIPEALRIVPGLHVAQIDGNKWAVSSRGFSERFVNKLLVLIDGRSIYTPMFSGVWWDTQDTIMEDIDRIEVIRGPGATIWGANAVNGIINIITRSSQDTAGTLMTTLAGGAIRSISEGRYGGQLGRNGHFRVYAKQSNRGSSLDTFGRQGSDGYDHNMAGFRFDKNLSGAGLLTVQSDIHSISGRQELLTGAMLTQPESSAIDESGGNILARWSQTAWSKHNLNLQVYYDRTKRSDAQHAETRSTLDFDFQDCFVPSNRHEIVWGLGYRSSSDHVSNSPVMRFNPASRVLNISNAFLQDDITLAPDRLKLTLGSKFEHNTYTGLEIQPNARISWTPRERQTVWAAVSKAVRTPFRVEHDGTMDWMSLGTGPGGVPIIARLNANKNIKAEELVAYEMGYRMQPSDRTSVDIAAFYNVYDHYRSFDRGTTYFEAAPVPHLVVPLQFGNTANERTWGTEIATNWDVTTNWKLAAALTYLHGSGGRDAGSTDMLFDKLPGNAPHRQFSIRSYLDLPRGFEFDAALYDVASLLNPNHPVPAYTRLDVRLGWRSNQDFEVSLVGQNLLQPHHAEFFTTFLEVPTEVERSVYAKVGYGF